MSLDVQKTLKWAVASIALQDAFTDFILSRQAMLCKPTTIRFYNYTAGRFMKWLEDNGVTSPEEISSRYIRAYLAELVDRKLSDSYINGHARAIKTLVKFLVSESYLEEEPKFRMPKIARKQLPVLTANQLNKVLDCCTNLRDKSLLMFMVDTGVRRKELCALNWEDVTIENGLVKIIEGKGGKFRSVVIGVKTRRALLKYRRTVNHSEGSPLFQTITGDRFSFSGLRSCLLRIGEKAGVRLSPHTLRRTFATLSLRGGMNPLHLQGLLGHTSLEMTKRYVQMVDDDLLSAHGEHGPIDRLHSSL